MRKRLSADARRRVRAQITYTEIMAEHDFTRKRLEEATARMLTAEEALIAHKNGRNPLRESAA